MDKMGNMFYTPSEVVQLNLKASERKAALPFTKMILLGIFSGVFIALGGAVSSTAVHGISDVGIARTVAACVFPVGLIMTVLLGAELFTGNNLMIMAVLDGRIRLSAMLRNLIVVYFSNLIGSLFVGILLICSGNLNYSGGLLGAYTIKVAVGKAALTPVQAVTSGILCNILVCIAVFMSTAARDVAGKILGAFFPIFAFVIGGFEHCVANMFYLPTGILAAMNPDYVAKAQETYGLSADQIQSLGITAVLHNLIPVTLGNMLGGMLFLGVPLYLIYIRKEK
jgi:formate/nitrite transporter